MFGVGNGFHEKESKTFLMSQFSYLKMFKTEGKVAKVLGISFQTTAKIHVQESNFFHCVFECFAQLQTVSDQLCSPHLFWMKT